MLDARVRRLIDPALDRVGRALDARGITAGQVTLAGLALGLLAIPLIAFGAFGLALALILANRVADGLDGAVARANRKADTGGYFDIVADMAFYGAVPMAFAFHDPAANGAAAAFLLASFYVNGASFLGFAVLAEQRGLETSAQGTKSLYYSSGLLEGTETIVLFVSLCLWPQHFAVLAWLFGAACIATALLRLRAAHKIFQPPKD